MGPYRPPPNQAFLGPKVLLNCSDCVFTSLTTLDVVRNPYFYMGEALPSSLRTVGTTQWTGHSLGCSSVKGLELMPERLYAARP